MDFNANSDSHTIIAYKRQLERSRGYNGAAFVNIGRLAELHGGKFKIDAIGMLNRIGIPTVYTKEE